MKSPLAIFLLILLCSCGGGKGGSSGGSPSKGISESRVEADLSLKAQAEALSDMWSDLHKDPSSYWNSMDDDNETQFRRGIEFGKLQRKKYPMSYQKAEFILSEFISAQYDFDIPDYVGIARKIKKENLK